MRSQLLKLSKYGNKWERKIGEIFKNNKIKFRFREKIGNYEADFVIGRVILEVDGTAHKQIDPKRDAYFFNLGYVPIHLSVKKVVDIVSAEEEIKKIIRKNNE